MTPPPTATDLWHAAGREGRDVRKRVVAALGLVVGVAAAMVVAVGARLLAGQALGDLPWLRPVELVLGPLRDAWLEDRDLALGLQLLAHAAVLLLVAARFGGELHRLAVVDLTGSHRESGVDARRFARAHVGAFYGARMAYVVGVVAPVVAIGTLALAGRLPGVLGGAGLAFAVAVGGALAVVAALVLLGGAFGGFLTGPLVAAEGADAFDAVTRAYGYTIDGLPALVLRRAWFFLGVLLGSALRAVRGLIGLLLGHAALSVGAPDSWARARAILAAGGTPPDAERLGLGFGDHLVGAVALAVVAGYVLYVLADFVARLVCARAAVYLLTRRDRDHVPVHVLRAAPRVREATRPEEAGFEEVARLGEDE
ncbi:MAG: hypothetical protein AB7T63_02680 [Planctomycetota bacterium]